jgi:glyoxylase-like metal-dependent hydrolase (beta-lactamase superfamily II)
MSTVSTSARRAALARLEEELASGKDSTGRALTADEKRHHQKAIGQRKSELAELASLQVVPPNLAFEGVLTLWLGGRRIELQDRGRANSPHDVTIYVPQDSVLFTGDIVVQSPLPYVGSSWPVPWIEVLQRLEAVPIKAMVPGHGPVMRDFDYVRQVRAMLQTATARVEAMALRGRTLEQVQDSVTLDDVRRSVPVWSDPTLDEDWKANVRVLIERAWRGVRGQG